MDKVLVTGAYGFVGAAYCAQLAEKGVPFIGAVRARSPGEKRPQIREVGDFVDADWAMILEKAGVNCVVHLAGRAHRVEGAAADARTVFRRENVKVTDRLLAAARLARVRRFVFSSSVKVHGQSTPPGVIVRESDAPAPDGEYGHSKLLAERRVVEFGHELGMETVILRLPLVYGPGVKANFAELVQAVRARRVLPFGAARNRRSLLGVSNLCSAIDAARLHSRAAGETFLVSDGKDVSTPELIRAIAVALRVLPRLWPFPPSLLLLAATLAGRRAAAERLLESFAIDSARIRATLQWSPPLTLADELERLAGSLTDAPP